MFFDKPPHCYKNGSLEEVNVGLRAVNYNLKDITSNFM